MTANHLPKIRGYEILNEVLPAGGLSNVYKARTKADNKVVAIKVLRKEFSKDPDRVKEFFNEAKVLKEVKHNNIAQILNIGSVNSQPYYFTMKYYRGGNLLKYIQNKKRLSLIEVLTISIQICEALDKIHREGYLHLDLKPSNILFDETNTLILTDFGSTKSILKDSNDETVIGTPQFMSPEQFDPEKQENFASDLYSLGILMYYMYAGSLPFNGKDAQQYQVMHTSTSPKSLKSYDKNINKDFNRIVTKLLEKEPVDRFVSSTKLKEELTNLKYKTQMHYKIKIEEIGQKGELVKSSTFKEYPIFLSKSKKAQNTFPIYDKEASKDHIRIEKNAEGNVYLRDTSTTGTVINGIRITNKSYFWQTDKAYLKIGNSKFILNKTKKNIGYKAYSFYSFLLVFIISIILYFGTNLFNERKLYISSFNIPQEVSVNENFNLNFKTTSDMTHDLSKVVIAPFGIKNKDKIVSYSANSFQSYSYDFTEVPAGENKYNFAIKLIDTEGNSSEWNKKKIIVNNYSDKLHIANLELPREVLVDSRVKYQFDLRSTLPKDKLFIE